MKKNVRQALAISGLAIAIGTSGFVLDASANNGDYSGRPRTHAESSKEKIFRGKRADFEESRHATRRIVRGTVTNIEGSVITITNARSGKTFTVNTDSKTRFLNKNWNKVGFSDIKTGNKIRVFGPISDTTVTAKTIRDISI